MGNERFGIHTIGNLNNTSLLNRFDPIIRGCRLRLGWKQFETSPGVYDNSYWLDDIEIATDRGKYVSVMSACAPVSNDNTPQWLFNNPYAVPLVTTDRGQYPHFMNTNFITRFKSHWLDGMKNMLLLVDPDLLLCWQSAEGSTGDQGTYKGTISGVSILGAAQPAPFTSYEISDPVWSNHKRTNLWPYIYGIINNYLPNVKLMLNIGNDFGEKDWLDDNTPDAYFKIGYPAHNYNLPAEKWQQEGILSYVNSPVDNNRVQAECENTEKLPWWADSPKRNIKSILASFAAHGGDIINISLADMDALFGTDLTLGTWINQYLGYRLPEETNKGFIIFRKIIDIADETLYPPASYGNHPVINPSDLNTYNNQVDNINNNTSFSEIQKKIKITDKKIAYINPARISALQAAFPDAAYHFPDADQDQDAYNTDFGVDMIQNYEKFVYQSFVDPGEEGVWRFGPNTTYNGRFGKKAANFYITTPLLGASNYQTRIEVKHHDSGSINWSLQYNNGSGTQTAGSIIGGNTGNILTAVFTIPDMQGGQVMTNDADFIITTGSSAKVTLEQIDFKRIAENTSTNEQPSANAGNNQVITAPNSTATLSGSGNDPDGTISSYLWTQISGPTTAILATPTAASTNAINLSTGTYEFQLEVTDNDGAAGVDTVTVTVNPGAPIANAGSNQTITLPTDSVTLNASGSTATSGSITGYAWTKISGPASGTITTPLSISTTVTGLTEGVYIYQVEVTNSFGLTDTSTVTVTVQASEPTNVPPTCSAGSDQTIQLPTSSTTLTATENDVDGFIASRLWTKVSGPAGGTIATATMLSTSVTGLQAGIYIYQYQVTDDDGATGSDTVTVTVNAAVDNPPVANAGPNQTVQLPVTSVTLDGSGSTDDNGITAQLWQFLDGPVTPAIVSPSALSTLVNGLTLPGDYRFKLTVQDASLQLDRDRIRVRVVAAPAPPIVLIETVDQTIELPNDTVSVDATVTAGGASIDTILWEQVLGAPATIVSPSAADTDIEDLQEGVNVFRITVTDTTGNTSYDELTIVVNSEPPPSELDPVAVILPVGTVHMPGAIQELDGSQSYDPDGSIVSYLWEIAPDSPVLDGFTIDDPDYYYTIVTFSTPGVRKFQLTVTDNDGRTNTTSVTFKVNEPPVITPEQSEINLTLPVNYTNINTAVVDNDGTVEIEWEQVSGPSTATIDDPTSDDILVTELEEGTYIFRLYATDNDGAQTYEDVYVFVNIEYNRALFNKTFRFYLCNDEGVSYKQDNGSIILQANTALRYEPEGWQDIEVKLPRNMKYFGVERNYTNSYKFVKDGAAIIRYLLYNNSQRGIESKLWMVVLKWDTVTGIYEPYFTSEVDLSEIDDEPKTGVTVNLIEGGAVKAIKTNENVVYELPSGDERIRFDGINLFDKYNYTPLPIGLTNVNGVHIYGILFVNNEGDSIGVQTGSQEFTRIGIGVDYFKESSNYLIKAAIGPITFRIQGTIVINFDIAPIDGLYRLQYVIATTEASAFTTIEEFTVLSAPSQNTFEIDMEITLQQDEKFFLTGFSTYLDSSNNISFEESELTIDITTMVPETINLASKPFDVFRQLVEKIGAGRYQAESSLLTSKWYLMTIAGDSLRGLDNAKIKTSFSQFYEAYGKILGAAIGVRQSDQTILFERKEYFFDNDSEIVDLGEVEGLQISIAKELLYNSVNVGYQDQDYSERNGRNEFNSEQVYSLPQSRVPAILDLISPYRADPYGMEFIRYNLFNKETTDNTGDNNVFIVNVDEGASESAQYNGSREEDQEILIAGNISFETASGEDFEANEELTEFTFTGQTQNVQIGINVELAGIDQTVFVYIMRNNSAVFTKQIIISGGTGGSTFGINNLLLTAGDVIRFNAQSVSSSFTVTDCSFTITFQAVTVYNLKRVTYDSISGIESADTIYNIEELTPKRILLQNYFYIGMLYKTPGDLVKFESGKKNTALSTTIEGITIAENTNIRVEDFADSPIRPLIFQFNTKVPVNILYLMQNAGKGYIRFTWNGHEFKAFPMELSVKPAFLDAQNWKCIASLDNDLSSLETVGIQSLAITDMGIISHKNSLKWVPLGGGVSLQYHLAHMDNELHYNRTNRYSVHRKYYQKQQTNDTTPMQFITRSTSGIVKIINCKGRILDTITPNQVTNAAVQFPYILMEAEIDWSQYEPGVYYSLLEFGVGTTLKQYLSEPIMVAEDWPDTILIEYGNSINLTDMIFNGGYSGKIRVEGFIQKYNPDNKSTSFEDEPLDIDTLYAVPFRKWELFIGGDFGTPDWMIDKVQRVLTLDSLQIEGYYYQPEPGAKFEPVEIPGSPFAYWRIVIREQNNRQGIPITGEGTTGGDLTVEYNINTKAFTSIQSPTVDATDNIIQVEDVE